MLTDLTIAIVNWNGGDLVRKCLRSIGRFPPRVPHDVVVVDNASSDGSVEWLTSVEARQTAGGAPLRVIENRTNVGFSRANNQVFAQTESPLVLLLNADTEVQAGSLDTLVETIRSDTRIGVCGPRLLDPDGSLQPSVYRNPATPWEILTGGFKLYSAFPTTFRARCLLGQHWDHSYRRDVNFVSGAAMMVRRDVIQDVGGMDERFPFYGEDIEWCLRIRRAGWKIVFDPSATIMHCGGVFSLYRWRQQDKLRSYNQAMLLCWKLSLPRWHAVANALASCLVFGIHVASRRIRRQSVEDLEMLFDLYSSTLRGWLTPGSHAAEELT